MPYPIFCNDDLGSAKAIKRQGRHETGSVKYNSTGKVLVAYLDTADIE